MALITATEFLRSKGYLHSDLAKGPKQVLLILNKHGISVEKTVPVAKGISFLVDSEKAEAAFIEKPSARQGGSDLLHKQNRSLARAVLAIANELGIELRNRDFINEIAEYKEQ